MQYLIPWWNYASACHQLLCEGAAVSKLLIFGAFLSFWQLLHVRLIVDQLAELYDSSRRLFHRCSDLTLSVLMPDPNHHPAENTKTQALLLSYLRWKTSFYFAVRWSASSVTMDQIISGMKSRACCSDRVILIALKLRVISSLREIRILFSLHSNNTTVSWETLQTVLRENQRRLNEDIRHNMTATNAITSFATISWVSLNSILGGNQSTESV